MNTVKIDLCGLPDELRSGLEKLCMHEGFRSGTDGIRLSARRAEPFPPSSTDRPCGWNTVSRYNFSGRFLTLRGRTIGALRCIASRCLSTTG